MFIAEWNHNSNEKFRVKYSSHCSHDNKLNFAIEHSPFSIVCNIIKLNDSFCMLLLSICYSQFQLLWWMLFFLHSNPIVYRTNKHDCQTHERRQNVWKHDPISWKRKLQATLKCRSDFDFGVAYTRIYDMTTRIVVFVGFCDLFAFVFVKDDREKNIALDGRLYR